MNLAKIGMATAALFVAAKIGIAVTDEVIAADPEKAIAEAQKNDAPAPETAVHGEDMVAGKDAITVVETPANEDATAGKILPEMLAGIKAEQGAILSRQEALNIREADLDLARATLLREREDLEALRKKLEELLVEVKSGHEDDLTKLVQIYSKMKPVQAGPIIGQLDLEVATMIVAEMKEAVSGPILGNMDPERARLITKLIYERSQLPGDQKPVVVKIKG